MPSLYWRNVLPQAPIGATRFPNYVDEAVSREDKYGEYSPELSMRLGRGFRAVFRVRAKAKKDSGIKPMFT
jgi:hypothetical protein